ncbi:sucrase/ferredoxin-like family protein [Aureobasidium pullulans]|nr:sucrase/ferredoxin-like family protein [Aureobasidium pullulans]THZ31289.1 sucrase/ferredoxin-like family protein [Aureobasidium pullulans]
MTKMASLLRGLSYRFNTPTPSTDFKKAKNEDALFPKTDPAVDGEDCLHDCESCSIKYPRKFEIDQDDKLYGNIGGWNTHLIVATGKTDWVRDVADEKGSVMEAVSKAEEPTNGKMMLSASNMPIPHSSHSDPDGQVRTTVLLLPAFKFIDNVTPAAVPDLIQHCVNNAPTNTSPLADPASDNSLTSTPLPAGLDMRDCPHNYLILLCSHATRDARCGQSAPLLKKELERQLRPLGLARDFDDERPGGVGIYFINHVGGHKYSANVLVYRRRLSPDGKPLSEAAQCIWLARIKPSDCENLVRYTVLQGKVVKPGEQLRGGFDRSTQLTSW